LSGGMRMALWPLGAMLIEQWGTGWHIGSPGRTVRVMPALPASLVSIARLPWMIGLAVWESGSRTAAVRTALVALIAIGFIFASFNIAFVGDGP